MFAFLLSTAIAAPAGAQTCGPIPAAYPISGGSQIDVGKSVRVNGTGVPKGKVQPDAVIDPAGVISNNVPQALPALVPATFPANGSPTNATEADSPFVAPTDVFYNDIIIGKNKTANFSGGGPFHVDKLELKDGATVNLAAGTYFIDDLILGKNARINVASSPVLLHIGNKFDAKKNAKLNQNGSVDAMRVFLHGGAEFKTDTKFTFSGVVLGPASDKIEIGDRSKITGALITSDKVELGKNTSITYTPAQQALVGAISTCPPVAGPDHFSISHSGSAVNCQAEPVIISAHQANHSVDATYAGTITVSTTLGNGQWSLVSGTGTLNPPSGSAIVTYAFAPADGGQVTLALKDPVVENVDINVADGGVVEVEDPPLPFAPAGFRFLADGAANSIGTQIAGKSSSLAPGAQTLEVQAINTNTATGACEAALTGPVNVDLAFECVDRNLCAAGFPVSIGASPIAGNPAGSVSAYTAVGLDFGNPLDTTATFTMTYPNAGRIRLHARYDIPQGGGTPSGFLMSGSSNAFVVRPFGIDVDFSGDRAANGTAGVSYAADATGSRFVKAGEGFATTLRAVAWNDPAEDSAPLDGVPDAGVDLTDNPATPSFGLEAVPATASVVHALALPAGGDAGTLSGGVAVGGFSAGAATTTLTWSEVGIIDLTATSTGYLGSGQDVTGTVTRVGRFYPARFVVADAGFALRDGPDAAWTCPFTYMDQPFAYSTDPTLTLTAQSLSSATTLNYGGSFWKFAAPFLAGRAYASTAATTAALDAPALGSVALSGQGVLDGIGVLTLSGESFAYLRASVPVAPFAAAITFTAPAADLIDADGVCYDSVNPSCNTNDGDTGAAYTVAGIAGAALRFGRLALTNAAGSELLDLAVPMQAQIHDGTGFVPSALDDCSAIDTAFLDLANDLADPPLGTPTIAIGAGTTTATLGGATLTAGDGGLSFSAPLAGNTGYADLRFDLSAALGAAQPWLRYDWDGDGNHDNDPTARATFGIYQGSPFLIHLREPWN